MLGLYNSCTEEDRLSYITLLLVNGVVNYNASFLKASSKTFKFLYTFANV